MPTATRRSKGVAAKKTSPSKDDEPKAVAVGASQDRQYFLLKSEPGEFSMDHLIAKPAQQEEWDGVRAFPARNVMRSMRVGDRAWFYHSSCKVPAIVGEVEIVRGAAPDQTALDPEHENYDPKSTPEACRWDSVLVRAIEKYQVPVTLAELRAIAKSHPVIADMVLLHRSRLSVQAVKESEWEAVLELQKRKEQGEDLLQIVP